MGACQAKNTALGVFTGGAGLALAGMLALGWYTAQQLDSFNERQIIAHIFKPGFSTAPALTLHAGRTLERNQVAGIVSLEADPYVEHATGEVACLYTVSRFSGAGAGSGLAGTDSGPAFSCDISSCARRSSSDRPWARRASRKLSLL